MSISIDNLKNQINAQKNTISGDTQGKINILDKIARDLDWQYSYLIEHGLGIDDKVEGDKLTYIKAELSNKGVATDNYEVTDREIETKIRVIADEYKQEADKKNKELAKDTVEFLKAQGEMFIENQRLIGEVKAEIDKVVQEVSENDSRIKQMQEEIDTGIEELNTIQGDITLKEAEIVTARRAGEDVSTLEDELAELVKRQGEKETENNDKVTGMEELQQKNDDLKAGDIYSNKDKLSELEETNKQLKGSFINSRKILEEEFQKSGVDLKEMANPTMPPEKTPETKDGPETKKDATEKASNSNAKGNEGVATSSGTTTSLKQNDNEEKEKAKNVIINYLRAGSTEERLKEMSDYGYGQLMNAMDLMKDSNQLDFYQRNELRNNMRMDKKYFNEKSRRPIPGAEFDDIRKMGEALGIEISSSDEGLFQRFNNIDAVYGKEYDKIIQLTSAFNKMAENGELSEDIIRKYETYVGTPLKFAMVRDSSKSISTVFSFGSPARFVRKLKSVLSENETKIVNIKNIINNGVKKSLEKDQGAQNSSKKDDLQQLLETYVRKPGEESKEQSTQVPHRISEDRNKGIGVKE